ncbi:MAG TPA: NusG domain II-containing protein [Planctomycetota bacterium]|nr:NusG domain II-containing protein [Planctomycetota bacterium]
MNKTSEIHCRVRFQDVLLSLIVLVGSFWSLSIFSTTDSSNSGNLVIYKNGLVIKEVSLFDNKIINLPVDSGNISIEIKPGSGVHILASSCPAKVCVHAGWIKQPGETIICLPNKVLMEISGENKEYDAISY